MNDAPPPRLNVESHALFLDFDGTLVDIADDPQAVVPAPGLASLLSTASEMFGGALALVTGRPLMFVDQRLGWAAPFGAGIHGLEIRGAPAPSLGAGARETLDRLRAHLSEEAQGLLVEDKGIAIALHYRASPDLAGHALKVAENWINASRGALIIQRGKMVVELKPKNADKGAAVSRFMREPPFAGRRPVYVGDDLTDEAGFAAARALGGFGIRVGEPMATVATYALRHVADVHEWLRQCVAQEPA